MTFRTSRAGLYDLPFFSMEDGRSRNQMSRLDCGVVQNMALGIAQFNLNAPVEPLRDFKVESNNYAADYGRTGNGLIIMSTRSGTNRFRNDVLDARTFFGPRVALLRYNIYGGSIGGPIKRDKTSYHRRPRAAQTPGCRANSATAECRTSVRSLAASAYTGQGRWNVPSLHTVSNTIIEAICYAD